MIGMIFGIYDSILPYHEALLAEARKQCTLLLIAVSSDEETTGLKRGVEIFSFAERTARIRKYCSQHNIRAEIVGGRTQSPQHVVLAYKPDVFILSTSQHERFGEELHNLIEKNHLRSRIVVV